MHAGGTPEICVYLEDYPDSSNRVTILDVRTLAEIETRHIPEAILIPYTELRERLDEVPRGKPVYTYCRSDFCSYISYIACSSRTDGTTWHSSREG